MDAPVPSYNGGQPIHNIQRQPTYPANHQIVDLRQNDLAAKANKRKTEIMIVMTMYNEDDQLFIKTMSSAIKNVAHLCSRDPVTADPATDPFRGFGDELFDIVRSLYIMVIVTIFISSMGNRPQGSKLIYTLCIVLFALIMATMLYCAGYTVYLSVIKDNTINFKKLQSIKEALSKAAFRDNGTSGDLAVAQPVAGKDGKKLLQVEVPTERKDINAAYDHLISDLKVKVREEKQHRDAATKKEDFYKLFRTNLVLVWMFTNGSLIVFFTSNTWKNYVAEKNINGAYNPYLTFVFWSVAGLSAFRTFGTVWYLIHRAIFG
ncbi:2505_t:CDS:2 [Entrophospora sp. SA101]|nr:2505_t:CDS:2 [Entrophospora sp. SA101]